MRLSDREAPAKTLFAGSVLSLITLFAATPGQAQTPASAEQFLRAVYAPYTRGKTGDPTGSAAPNLFSAEILALIRKDQEINRGEVGAIDADPICACQDLDKLSKLKISVQPRLDGHANATVSFINFSHPTEVRFDLIPAGTEWRIDDISEEGIPSLRDLLKTSNASAQ